MHFYRVRASPWPDVIAGPSANQASSSNLGSMAESIFPTAKTFEDELLGVERVARLQKCFFPPANRRGELGRAVGLVL